MASILEKNPKLPFLLQFPEEIEEETKITIKGSMPIQSDRFVINLQCGNKVECSDAALHLSVLPPKIVINTFESHSWQPEEFFEEPCGIRRGAEYEIGIQVGINQYSIFVNGKKCYDFDHRIELHRVSHISISGDTSVEQVEIEGPTLDEDVNEKVY